MKNDIRLVKSNAQIIEELKTLLAKRLKAPVYHSWIAPLAIISFENGEMLLGVCNEFMGSMITSQYKAPIQEALREIVGDQVTIKVQVDSNLSHDVYTGTISSIAQANPLGESVPIIQPPQEPNQALTYTAEANRRAAARTGGMGQAPVGRVDLVSKANLNPKYTFDSFVVGSNNRFTHSAAAAVAVKPGQSYNPLFIYGGVGLGKTHIMHAIGNEIISNFPHLSIKYISCERFTNDLVNSIRENRMVEFRKRYRQLDVLLVDDIQFIEGKESTQEEFFYTFNALKEANKQIILSSDRPPKSLSKLEERLKSRFEWGLISDMQAPDVETRLAILRKKCVQENMPLSDDILEQIASTITSNIRELEGALIRVHAYSNLTGGQTDSYMLRSVLSPSTAGASKPPLTVDFLIQTVASIYSLEPAELKSSKRSQDLTLPRHIAMYLAHDDLMMSYPRIGEAFGNRKHTSALYAHSRIKGLLEKDLKVKAMIAQIRQKLSV
ncbi:MAG: chromosomal replication initiator protein DnaA [Candidatus Obscuribacterales bacterium]|nr:chromosomal replication initiator protein DnaA [Candidatus Obscuribacterales bacterium]